MRKNIRMKTKIFAGFMLIFFFLLTYLTYYSHVTYQKNLPIAKTVMPERTEKYNNGRYSYIIPGQAVLREKDTSKIFIYTAREHRDVLGERSIVTRIEVRVQENLGNGNVLIDGITKEEPVITENAKQFFAGQAVLQEEMER